MLEGHAGAGPAGRSGAAMGTVVDIHCHTFNGDDLPIRGFVHKVALRDADGLPARGAIAALVDRIVQAGAPGHAEETRRLDTLLLGSRSGFPESLSSARVPDLDAVVAERVAQLQASDPELLAAARAEAGGEVVTTEGLRDLPALVRRGIAFGALFTQHRWENTVHLVRQFPSVDLFTPMLVDLGLGVGDPPETTVREQVELQEKISRLSMLGRIPDAPSVRVHPFVGFDPRRQIASENRGDPFTALDRVKLSVERFGCVGVKLYPPMGFRPLNNATRGGGPVGQDGPHVDRVLRELYTWCLEQDVPITAHANSTQGSSKDYDRFSDPADWATVLAEFPGLHLNLGHFGGTHTPVGTGWAGQMARLAGTPGGEHLYADVSNHNTRDAGYPRYRDELRALLRGDGAAMRERVMYGSDWFMLVLLENLDTFLADQEADHQEPNDDPEGFFGERALRFLGFDDPGNRNAQRLLARYRHYAPHDVPEWLAH